MDLRLRLLAVNSEDEFKKLLWEHTKELAEEQQSTSRSRKMSIVSQKKEEEIEVGYEQKILLIVLIVRLG